MSQSDIREVEVTIEQARKQIKLGEALQRLMNNQDFKDIVLEQYLREEAVRLVHLKADADMQDPRRQQNMDMGIAGIGLFRVFCDRIQSDGEAAEEALQEHLQTLDDVQSEIE